MITRDSIDELIATLDIVEVVGTYLTLKKSGSVQVGPCPFHNEKSASFNVSASKQIFKCFGCGEGGDALAFVMKKENIEFIPAIRLLASRYNFTLEETEESQEDKEAAAKKADLWKINAAAAKHYRENLMELQSPGHWATDELMLTRGFNLDTIIEFSIGYAPNVRRLLTEIVTEKGLFYPAEELGLVKTNEDGETYDVFRNRIIFPIHDEQGRIVGFGGRKPSTDENKTNPKYINSKDSLVYRKDRVLYGLYQAKTHIKEMGYAIIVEGYTDVISLRQGGAPNTVGVCGTALTEYHAKLLKRFTNNVILMLDGDDAGKKAIMKAVNILIGQDLKVEICPLPEKHDPDSFAREISPNNFSSEIYNSAELS